MNELGRDDEISHQTPKEVSRMNTSFNEIVILARGKHYTFWL